MNQFKIQFEQKIQHYFEGPGLVFSAEETEAFSKRLKEKRDPLLAEMKQYADANEDQFKREIKELLFDNDLSVLLFIYELFAKDIDKWGAFTLELINAIFEKALQSATPNDYLSDLSELYYFEEIESPYVQKIVDRLYQEINASNIDIQLAVLWILPSFLENKSVKNKTIIKDAIIQKINDSNWRVRYVAYHALNFEEMLPAGAKLSILDHIRRMVLGAPQIM